jgi:hypothetical protein
MMIQAQTLSFFNLIELSIHKVANRDYFYYMRDLRITGSPYVMRGLEAQPTPDDAEKINPEELAAVRKGGFLKNPLLYTVRER